MSLLNINLNDPLMKAIKAVNSIAGNSLTEEDLRKQRQAMELAGRLAVLAKEVTVTPFKIDDLNCEWVTPENGFNPRYTIMYAHGGGYTCGGLSYARILASKLAMTTGFRVFSFEYRLAPENKYPAAFDDGMKVWDYLMRQGYGAREILMAGDSAGGNMVLCLTQKLLSEGRIPPRALMLPP